MPDVSQDQLQGVTEEKPQDANDGSPCRCADNVQYDKLGNRYLARAEHKRCHITQAVKKAEADDDKDTVKNKYPVYFLSAFIPRRMPAKKRSAMITTDKEKQLIAGQGSDECEYPMTQGSLR